METYKKLDITTSSWVRGLLILAIFYGAFLIKEFILVIIVSVVIASAIEPIVRWTGKRHIPRLPVVLLVYLFLAVAFAGLFYYLILPLVGDISDFIRTLTIYFNSLSSGGILSDMFRTQNLFAGFDTPILVRELSTHLNTLATFLSKGIFSSLSTVFGGLLNFVLILVLSFYLVVQEDGVSKFLKTITPLKHEQYIVDLWRRSQIKIGLWMQGQLISSVLIMLLVYIGLLFIGIPNALLLAVLAGVFELIPLFGATLAAIPAIFVAYIAGGGMTDALIVAGLFFVIQQLEGNLIHPLVVKKMVGVPPMISIIALVIGGTLAGFLGVLISVPVAAVVMELVADFDARKVAQMSQRGSS